MWYQWRFSKDAGCPPSPNPGSIESFTKSLQRAVWRCFSGAFGGRLEVSTIYGFPFLQPCSAWDFVFSWFRSYMARRHSPVDHSLTWWRIHLNDARDVAQGAVHSPNNTEAKASERLGRSPPSDWRWLA